MSVSIKSTPVLVRPAGSHWLELNKMGAHTEEPFSKEELYPILEVQAPRVGLVRAGFECSRYVASSYDDATGKSSPLWSDWRIYLRDVRTPDEERPEIAHLGREAAGIGDATRAAIRDACEPIIREWLASDEYLASRRRVAASAVVRELDAPAEYTIQRGQDTLSRVSAELEQDAIWRIQQALELLEQARAMIDAISGGGQ